MNIKPQDYSILIVEDYQPLRDDLVSILSNFFKTIIYASDGEEGINLYNNYKEKNGIYVDIILSDIEMPQMNGITMCHTICDINPEQLIIMLSAHTDSEYLISCINIGITKFIPKPINEEKLFGTLQQTIKILQEQREKLSDSRIIEFDLHSSWNADTKILTKDGKAIPLTLHNTVLLELFLKNCDLICTNTMIAQAFYKHNIEMDEKNIRNQVLKLRKKLPNRIIESVYGKGYKFSINNTQK